MKKVILSFLSSVVSASCLAAPPVFMDDYEKALESKGPVLVIFGTEWCPSCKKLKSEIKDLNLDDYVVCMVNPEQRRDIGSKYDLRYYPTSVIIKQKNETSRRVGYEKIEYQKWLDKNK